MERFRKMIRAVPCRWWMIITVALAGGCILLVKHLPRGPSRQDRIASELLAKLHYSRLPPPRSEKAGGRKTVASLADRAFQSMPAKSGPPLPYKTSIMQLADGALKHPRRFWVVPTHSRLVWLLAQLNHTESVRKLCEAADRRGQWGEREPLWNDAAVGYASVGNVEAAFDSVRRISDHLQAVMQWVEVSKRCRDRSNNSAAVEAWLSACRRVDQVETPSFKVDLLCDLAVLGRQLHQVDAANTLWEEAIRIALTADNEGQLLHSIVIAQGRCGMLAAAFETYNRFPRDADVDAYRSGTLFDLCTFLAMSGDLPGAIRKAETLTLSPMRGAAYCCLADVAHYRKLDSLARELLIRASATALIEPQQRLAVISVYRKSASRWFEWYGLEGLEPLLTRLQELTQELELLPERVSEQRENAELLARIPGKNESSRQAYRRAILAARLEAPLWRDGGLCTIVESQVKVGMHIDAYEIASDMELPSLRDRAKGGVCYPYVLENDWGKALKIWREVGSSDPIIADGTLLLMASAAIETGRPDRAAILMDAVESAHWRGTGMYYVARAMAKTFDTTDLLQRLQAESSPWVQRMTLLGVAEIEAEFANMPAYVEYEYTTIMPTDPAKILLRVENR